MALLTCGEAVLLPRFDVVANMFAEARRMRLLGPAASVEAAYLGSAGVDSSFKSESTDEMLSYLKTYHEVTGRWATLAASPRVM